MILSMNSKERTATFSIAGLFALRMLALFMVLPVLQLYATDYQASPAMLGWVIGIYGLSQAAFQIPLGRLSDRIGRYKVILGGLALFVLGSLVAAKAHSLTGLMIGRGLQGAGAIGSTLLAYVSDVTREQVRTSAMAIVGITIGFSFLLGLMLGPLISAKCGLSGLFWFTFWLGLLGMAWFAFTSKESSNSTKKSFFSRDVSLLALFKEPQLFRLNLSILILHAQFSAVFLFLPKLMTKVSHLEPAQLWRVYVPVLVMALIVMSPLVRLADKSSWAKPILILGICLLGLTECILGLYPLNYQTLMVTLVVFFAAFSLLEAQLPSWVSKVAPKEYKGSALGIYSTSQFFGIFLGGVVGGMLQNAAGTLGIVLGCVLLVLFWFICTLDLAPPKRVATVS